MTSYRILGLMSGTSMDGLDIADIFFSLMDNGNWQHTVNQTKTIDYPGKTLDKLKNATNFKPVEILKLDKELGKFFANAVNDFIESHQLNKADFDAISSHGHTIFHQPDQGFTLQIGCGETIAFETGIKVINDFRQKDVVAGGQGAPLVPIGDKLLFNELADSFLNIGGFSNICVPNTKTIAFDICPANLPMNKIANSLNLECDFDGKLASEGEIDSEVLDDLNNLSFYRTSAPKSLGVEWLITNFYPILDKIRDPKDKLRTLVEHIAIQITKELESQQVKSVLITGGGAKNKFLIKRIHELYKGQVQIPATDLIDFKEAIIFGFLGALYLCNKTNTLSSVTGAQQDTIGGVLHLP